MSTTETMMLARLIAQAEAEGAALVTLRALVEEASATGAEAACRRLGLDDARARGDLGELRELLGAWRDAKSSAWKAAAAWVTRLLLALILVGVAVKTGLLGKLA
ncbi:DUF6127 family protein [Sphingomonas jatrophae]|uniref:Uncharacterized protein n=1 Tax=Sphingomonas jatrophae TaxID=1166337 RepID=A0A1I6L3Q6_9SPHN|nr:DUF6127 family protein [Sphingomonas jatrophae]SFR98079.1 hypothetical protein SAMN05192580_2245 [Sphingomonas jatrophae]